MRIGQRLVNVSTPRVMGILNITPDSFYAASRVDAQAVASQAGKMLAQGADFLDVGGYSSRPGAVDISAEEEIARVVPAIRAIKQQFPEAILSIDTFRSAVAQQALDAGAEIVNDISGGSLDPNMIATVAAAKVPYIVMHMQGTPQTMQQQTTYHNLQLEMMAYFGEKINLAIEAGIADIILDPGFGFAKTVEQNFETLAHLQEFERLERPLLVGLSRKSMIWKTLQNTPEMALNGTTAAHMMALQKGASILRVHDVEAAVECIKIFRATSKYENETVSLLKRGLKTVATSPA